MVPEPIAAAVVAVLAAVVAWPISFITIFQGLRRQRSEGPADSVASVVAVAARQDQRAQPAAPALAFATTRTEKCGSESGVGINVIRLLRRFPRNETSARHLSAVPSGLFPLCHTSQR
jgi:hypothetical protein